MKPPKSRTLTKPDKPGEVDPKVAQLAHDEVVQLLAEGIGRGVFHNGVVFEAVTLSATAKELFHNLGRVPTVLLMLKATGTVAQVYETTKHASPRTHINVAATGGVTGNLLIA